MTEGTKRADIKLGLKVSIVLKQDQRTGKLTKLYANIPIYWWSFQIAN